MTLLEYQDGYINAEAISRLYIRELTDTFKNKRYELILITMDGHTHSCFTGIEKAASKS